jgi:hypothetical protein
MGRKNVGKTKTIKERALYIYLPSMEMVGDWKQRAEKAGTSISRFVMDRVEDSLKREAGEEEGYLSRMELIEKVRYALEENKKLKEENRMLTMLNENLDKEAQRFRAKAFLEEGFTGLRAVDIQLIALLRKGRMLSNEEILSELRIDLEILTELVKAVTKQLHALEAYGLVEYGGRGWKWTD